MVEIRCESLNDEQFQTEADFVFRTLEQRPNELVKLIWGFGNDPKSWDPVNLRAATVRSFIENAAKEGVYDYGDVVFKLSEHALEILLCHERDVHITSQEESWLSHFTDRWLSHGIAWYRRENADAEWQLSSPHY